MLGNIDRPTIKPENSLKHAHNYNCTRSSRRVHVNRGMGPTLCHIVAMHGHHTTCHALGHLSLCMLNTHIKYVYTHRYYILTHTHKSVSIDFREREKERQRERITKRERERREADIGKLSFPNLFLST